MSRFDKFKEIRKEYAMRLPTWMAEYRACGDMCQDPYFMNWQFSPIEEYVWCDIRSIGVPFFPQFPALNYFLDFANPFLKIGIECDGKQWHDAERDRARDTRLVAAGWKIYRIEGHECKRVVVPWEEEDKEKREEMVRRYFMETSEGVIYAINECYFRDEPNGKYIDHISDTLGKHLSTPEIRVI